MRILVVEDEVRLASLLRRGLTEEGHAVDLAADGEEALAWIDAYSGSFDAVVLDIMLPGVVAWRFAGDCAERAFRPRYSS